MTSFHAGKCRHLVSAHGMSASQICSSICQFLIYRTFLFNFVVLNRMQLSSAQVFATVCINLHRNLVQKVIKFLGGYYHITVDWSLLATALVPAVLKFLKF